MAPKSPAPFISVVVAVRNGARTLQRCISSVAQQVDGNCELIIIDAVSSDGTIDILKENDEVITYWISEPDRGISDAWNKGVEVARGQWLFFLGADDYLWDTTVLSRMTPILQSAYPRHGVIYGRVACVDSNGVIQGIHGQEWMRVRTHFLTDMSIPHQGTFHHKSLFSRLGGFDPAFRYACDYEFLLRELPQADALHVPEVVVSGMEIGGFSSNLQLAPECFREFARARVKNGLNPYPLLWCWRYSKAICKRAMCMIAGERRVNELLSSYRRVLGQERK